jgi:hypothetical protein
VPNPKSGRFFEQIKKIETEQSKKDKVKGIKATSKNQKLRQNDQVNI